MLVAIEVPLFFEFLCMDISYMTEMPSDFLQ